MQMIQMTATRGGEMLRAGRRLRRCHESATQASERGSGRLVIPAAVATISLFLAGCLGNSPPPVTAMPTTAAACEAMRPAFPITYSSKSDTAETVRQVRGANARFLASCP